MTSIHRSRCQAAAVHRHGECGGETLDQLIGKKRLRIQDLLKRTLVSGEGSGTRSTVLRARAFSFIGGCKSVRDQVSTPVGEPVRGGIEV